MSPTTLSSGLVEAAGTSAPPTPGGQPTDTSRVLDEVLTHTVTLLNHLQALSVHHATHAPASSGRIRVLSALLAGTVLEWIDEWPS